MKIRKTAIAGIISLAALVPAKAQKPVQYISEIGVTGEVRNKPLLYGGMNFCFSKGKNFTDLFAGMNINSNKQASLLALAINNYNWTNNISSWVRGVLAASNRGANFTCEASPIRGNVKVGKFDLSLNPAYAMYNDIKNKTTTQGINTIFQTTYSMTPKDKIFLEAKYTSDPNKNLFDTHFGQFKDNISYMLAYMRNF